MKQRLTVWLSSKEIEQLQYQSQETDQTISVIISNLLSSTPSRSEPDPIMVALQHIQAQLAELQQKVNGTFTKEQTVTKNPVRVVSDKPSPLAAKLTKQMSLPDTIPLDQLDAFMDPI